MTPGPIVDLRLSAAPARWACLAILLSALPLHALLAETSATSSAATSSTPGTGDIINSGTGQGTSTRPDPTTTAPTPPSQPPAAPTSAPPTPPPPNPARDGTSASPGSSPNPGDFAEDVARAEAERAIGAPMPVVRLDKPEFVFSNADPEVAAGVQAWLATLKGPHDQYGNFTGPGFKGSFRPDSVNKQLVAFLANYLAGKRLVAVNPGQASGLATAQDKSRKDAVESIVKARREAASRAATPPGTGTGTRENVPPINNGADGQAGNGNSQSSTGTTTRTSSAGSTPGSQPTSSSSSGNQSASPSTARAVEQKYPGIKVSDQPKAFTTDELGFLDNTLGKLPQSFFDKTEFRRTSVISMNGTPDEQVFGATKTSPDLPLSILELSDRSFSNTADHRVDFPTPPYSTEESKKLQFQGTIAHELTHRFLRFNPGDKFYADMAQNPLISNEDGWAAKFGWSFDPAKQKWALDPSRRREAPTRYAMEDNPSEDMAESVMLFVLDPQRLRAASPERYAFVRDRLKVAEQPEATTTFPPPKNDPRYQSLFAQGN